MFDDITRLALNALGWVALAAVSGGLSAQTSSTLISEFQPNPPDSDPGTQTVELSGTPGEGFSGVILSIEADFAGATVDSVATVSGTFDSNGLLTVEIPDLENPSFTVVLADRYAGSVGDAFSDTDLGTTYDAIGIPDSTDDEARLLGASLGGADFAYTGAEPQLVFRDASIGDWFAVNALGFDGVFDINAMSVPAAKFDLNPTGAATFGAINPSETSGDGNFEDRYVHEVQGRTDLADETPIGGAGFADASPLIGISVRVEGIVTRVLADLNGFYLQEEDDDADTDPFTSEGVFIAGDIGFSIGDLVTVEGTVVEVEGETTINASNTTLVSSNNPLPASTPVTLPTATVLLDTDGDFVANLEQYEGMLVNIPTTLSVTELFQLDRFGTIRVSEGGRLSQFTQGNAPDAAGFRQHLKAIAARSLVFDDGQNVQNPSPILVPGLGALMNGDVFRMGDTYSNTTGVLSYSEDQQSSSEEPEYRVHLPDTTLDQTDNPRPVSPQRVGGTLRVASFNVLNFFTTLDTFPDIEEVGPLPSPQPPLGPRGADTNPQNASPTPGPTDEYDRQLAKLVQAIVDIDADIVGLIELENDFLSEGDAPRNADTVIGSGVAIEELVAALNARLQADVYEWVVPSGQISTSGEFVGSDAIAVGFIYQPATVGLVGSSAVLDTSDFLDPNASGTNRNRAALAQTFQHLASGESFTAVVNHFKSKGASGLGSDPACLGDPPTGPDCDQFDGQGYWNNTRTAAARVLIDWLATDPTGSGDGDVLILGDLNAYAQEDPIIALIAGEDDTVSTDDDYTNLAAEFLGAGSYSFVFDGQTGTLDYALASASLRAQVAGVTEWHINADEADAFDYNLEFGRDPNLWTGDAFRASDHDPVLIGLDLAETVPGTPVTKDDCKKGGWRSLARADGSAFRNQGQCIRYVNTGR